ncbi:winged helix-turn-helix domain-containing protein [Porticoccus sp.]
MTQPPAKTAPNTLKPRLRLLYGSAIAFGPGKAELLQHIATTGSISAAAKCMNMSYRRAWQLVETMNRCFQSPLVLTSKGGSGGGGASVSELGQKVLRLHTELLEELATAPALQKLQTLLAKQPPDEK